MYKHQSTPQSISATSRERTRSLIAYMQRDIIAWMRASVQSQFPHARQLKCRIRPAEGGRNPRYELRFKSQGIYFRLDCYSLEAFTDWCSHHSARHRMLHQ